MGVEVDTLYKALPKAHAWLGGQDPMHRKMYEEFTRIGTGHSLFRSMNAGESDVLVPGSVRVMMTENGKPRTHLWPPVHTRAFSAEGLFAMGDALFNLPAHRQIAYKLVDGCVWAHHAMPEVYETIPCASQKTCPLNE